PGTGDDGFEAPAAGIVNVVHRQAELVTDHVHGHAQFVDVTTLHLPHLAADARLGHVGRNVALVSPGTRRLHALTCGWRDDVVLEAAPWINHRQVQGVAAVEV